MQSNDRIALSKLKKENSPSKGTFYLDSLEAGKI
jgi:hypothetical protein